MDLYIHFSIRLHGVFLTYAWGQFYLLLFLLLHPITVRFPEDHPLNPSMQTEEQGTPLSPRDKHITPISIIDKPQIKLKQKLTADSEMLKRSALVLIALTLEEGQGSKGYMFTEKELDGIGAKLEHSSPKCI
jgi:hypothetical protein